MTPLRESFSPTPEDLKVARSWMNLSISDWEMCEIHGVDYGTGADELPTSGPEFEAAYSSWLEDKFGDVECEIDCLVDGHGMLEIWREITALPEWSPAKNGRHLGECWSWDVGAAEAHWGTFGKGHVKFLIHGRVRVSDVLVGPTLGLNVSNPEEKEIRLKPVAKVEVLGWKRSHADKWNTHDADWEKGLAPAVSEAREIPSKHADKASLRVPPVLCHGSKKEFAKFDLDHFGQTDDGYYGVGVYLATDFEHANDYGWWVYQVHVRDPKPFFLWSSSSGGNAHQARVDLGDVPDYAHVKPRTDLPNGYEVVPYEKTDNYGHYLTRQGYRVQPNEELQAAHVKATRDEQAESDIRWGDFAETPEQAVTVFHDDGEHEYGWTSSMLKRLGRRDFAGVLQKHGYNCLCTYDENGISEVMVFDPEDVVIDKVVNHPNKYDVYESSARQLIERAFHGTPHTIKGNFCVSKIGTGEGAQAYGWGIYFADRAEVADTYNRLLTLDRYQNNDANYSDALNVGLSASEFDKFEGFYRGNPATGAEELAEKFFATTEWKSLRSNPAEFEAVVAFAQRYLDRMPVGNTYQVEIDADPADLLEWDKLLSDQSAHVKSALRAIGVISKERWVVRAHGRSWEIRRQLPGRKLAPLVDWHVFHMKSAADYWAAKMASGEYIRGNQAYNALASRGAAGSTYGARAASEKMRDAGIPGIKYLDGNSRGEGQGTYNYVIFDPSIVRVIGTTQK